MSDISRLSHMRSTADPTQMAASYAKCKANQHVAHLIQSGHLDKFDHIKIALEYRSIYSAEYYKYCAQYYANLQHVDQQSRIIYIERDGLHTKRYYQKHTVANFNRLNCFVHVHRDCITVGRINYQLDDESSLDTKESFLSNWPGPLDGQDDQLRREVTYFVDTLWQHDSQRRIKYLLGSYDEQRKVILKLLTELLHRNGTVDAPTITRLLLKPDQTEIQKDESNKRPLETLQKYLLLGKLNEAIRFAKSTRLWDHAQCIAFLDKYQPRKNITYISDGLRLKDDTIVQLNEEFICSIKPGILQTVYRCLLGKLYGNDPESVNIIKPPNVKNDPYEFAMLSANDCEMEFDKTNEIFKLIIASKKVHQDPDLAYSHLISLGLSGIESLDPSDGSSNRSHPSFKQADTYASRTLTISNIDLLILNEVWEFCLNLARASNNSANYEYIGDLIPYKLIFASKLLDYGLHKMFACYLNSIKNALYKTSQSHIRKDPFYDWDSIKRSVDHLSKIWDLLLMSPEGPLLSAELPPQPSMGFESQFSSGPPAPQQQNFVNDFVNPTSYNPPTNSRPQNYPPEFGNDPSYNNNYPSMGMQYQAESGFDSDQNYAPVRHQNNIPRPQKQYIPHTMHQEVTDFNPEPVAEDRNHYDAQPSYPNDEVDDLSRRSSVQPMDVPVFSPPSFGPPNIGLPERQLPRSMTSSSPVNKNRDSMQSNANLDSFNAFSPINDYEDLPRGGKFDVNQGSMSATQQNSGDTRMSKNSAKEDNPNSTEARDKSQQSNSQAGFLTNLVGSAKALLPKSNSKPMILPDDRSKSIVFDEDKKKWIDTSKGEAQDDEDMMDAPPVMKPTQKPLNYSMAPKSTKSRYPAPIPPP